MPDRRKAPSFVSKHTGGWEGKLAGDSLLICVYIMCMVNTAILLIIGVEKEGLVMGCENSREIAKSKKSSECLSMYKKRSAVKRTAEQKSRSSRLRQSCVYI